MKIREIYFRKFTGTKSESSRKYWRVSVHIILGRAFHTRSALNLPFCEMRATATKWNKFVRLSRVDNASLLSMRNKFRINMTRSSEKRRRRRAIIIHLFVDIIVHRDKVFSSK